MYELSLIHGKIYGALLLILLHAGCSLHAGIFKDVSTEPGGNMIEYYYASYFYIKVKFVFSRQNLRFEICKQTCNHSNWAINFKFSLSKQSFRNKLIIIKHRMLFNG